MAVQPQQQQQYPPPQQQFAQPQQQYAQPQQQKPTYDPHMVDRDPNEINDHLKVAFEDVIAEPDGAHSADCVWRLSYSCFNGGKNCCYKTLTCLCGCWIALCWGCEFACLTFVHIWEFTPMLRAYAINCGCMQKFWGTALQCMMAPICETCGLLFSRIEVKNVQ